MWEGKKKGTRARHAGYANDEKCIQRARAPRKRQRARKIPPNLITLEEGDAFFAVEKGSCVMSTHARVDSKKIDFGYIFTR